MKKISLTLLACLFIISGWSQNNLATFVFEGKQLNVYPYRAKSNNSSTDNMFLKIQENIDIPYCPLTLPDGDYVVFYPKDCHYDKNSNPYYLKGDTDNVAIVFSIKGGKREGQARWFTEYFKGKRCYQTGNYVANEKDGNWNYHDGSFVKTYQYRNGLLDGEVVSIAKSVHITRVYHFSKGQLHGKYLIKNTKTKDIIEFEFINGALYGKYHSVFHNSSAKQLVRLNFNRSYYNNSYDGNEKVYKKFEVYGQFNDNLKYGEWNITTDDRKIIITYDTLNSENKYLEERAGAYRDPKIVRPYYGQYSDDRVNGDPFALNIIRSQFLKYRDYQFFYINNNPISNFLEMGYGSYKEYDKKGNLINANSFYDESLKFPFQVKDLNGNTLTKMVPAENSIFIYEAKRLEGVKNTTYLKTDTGLTELESFIFNKVNKDYVTNEWERSLNYYKYHQLTNLKTITSDSTVITSKYGKACYTQCIDVGTGFRFSRSYYNDSVYETPWSIDSLHREIMQINRKTFGQLTILDTMYFKLGPIKNIFTDPNYSYRYELVSESRYSVNIPDSFRYCFLWKGERFTGDINFRVFKKYNSKMKEEAWEIQDESLFNFHDSKSLMVQVNNYALQGLFQFAQQELEPTSIYANVNNGVLSGDLTVYSNYGKRHVPVRLYKATYSYNLKNGIEEKLDCEVDLTNKLGYNIRVHIPPKLRMAKSFPEPKVINVRQNFIEYQFYKEGKKEGTSIRKTNEGQIENILNYSKGLLDGTCLKLSEKETPLLRVNFKNDTLNGIYESFNSKYELTNITNFKNGLPHGKYFKYEYRNQNERFINNSLNSNVNFCKERKINTIELEFNNGLLVNNGKYYHCDGILKAQVTYDIKDSVSIIGFVKNYNRFTYYNSAYNYTPKNESYNYRYYRSLFEIQPEGDIFYSYLTFDFYPNLPGSYIYFYKSGIRSQEGKVGKDGLKTGWWKFWNENGVLMKEILYEKGAIVNPLNPNDSIQYTGKIIGYHPNGKFMMEGYVLDEDFKYECVQDEDMAYQDVFYTRFVNENGMETYKGYSGMVKDYHINGNKREEGMMLNGRRNGLWKTYESNGNLSGIGYYKNGKKDGSWLYGDLSGIGFVDNQCFDFVIDINKIKGNLSEDHLQFEETIYEDGNILKNTVHNVDIE